MSPAGTDIQVNAVAFKEGDAWVIQGIEYDIVAHASDVSMLPDAFTRAILENIIITKHLGRQPLAGIMPAPNNFVEMYEHAVTEVRSVKNERGPSVVVRLAA